MMKHLKQTIIQTLKVGFSFALIFWLIQSGKLEFSSLTRLLAPAYLIPGLLLIGTSLALGTERWRRFIIAQGLTLTFPQAFRLTLIGTFFNFAMPGGVGGDLVKGYYLTKNAPDAKLKAAITVLMDRLIGLFAMLILAMTMMILHWELVGNQPELKFIFNLLCLLGFAFILFWALTFSRRLHRLELIENLLKKLPKSQPLLRTYEAITSYRHVKKTFLIAFALSLTAQIVSVFFFVVAGYGLGFSNVSPSLFFFVIPIAFMVQAVPISPAGVGVGQAAAFFLFNLVAPGSGAVGPATTTAYQLGQFLFSLIGAYFYLGISKKLKNS